jgi:CRP-like cAMP-binding protein
VRTTSVGYRLSDSPLFAKCDRQERNLVDRIGTQVRRPAGTVLAREGALSRQFMVILDGIATACHADGIEEIAAGGAIGIREIILCAPHSASIVAETPVVLEVLSVREFAALLEAVPRLRTDFAPRALARAAASCDASQ